MSNRSIGVVIDANLRQAKDGRLWLDHIKKAFRELVRTSFQDDSFYLYLPGCLDATSNRGEQVSWIGNFFPDGSKCNLSHALLQTMYVVVAEDEGEDWVKVVYFVSNRLSSVDKKPLEDFLLVREKEGLSCHLKTILVGGEVDAAVATAVGLDFVQVEDPEMLPSVVKEILEKCQSEVDYADE